MPPFFNIFRFMSICTWVPLIILGCAAKYDYKAPAVDMPMVFVEGGTFRMGSDDDRSARPVRQVTVPDLYVGIHEVTFAQYDTYCRATGCESPGDEGWGRKNRPVINVTWHDANAFAEWLSAQTGQRYRLPSEAEWEYFARAGTTTNFWTGDDLPAGAANCRDCGSKWDNRMTAPVGSFKPNPWGIFDTMGNVTEWVLDDFEKGYQDASGTDEPFLADHANRKVQRGGSWSYNKKYLQSATRDYRRPDSTVNDTGFRLVLVPDEL